MIRELEEHQQDARLIALNLAFEAASMGESGRKLFEFACESLEYSKGVSEKVQLVVKHRQSQSSDPAVPLSIIKSGNHPVVQQRNDEQIAVATRNVQLNRIEVERLLGDKKADSIKPDTQFVAGAIDADQDQLSSSD